MRTGAVKKSLEFARPPMVGTEFARPPICEQKGRYSVAAIVDLGFYSNNPTYYHVVFRFWAAHKKRYAYEVVSAHALEVGLYTPVPRKKKRAKKV